MVDGGVVALVSFIVLAVIGLVIYIVLKNKNKGDKESNTSATSNTAQASLSLITGRKDQIGDDGLVLNIDCVGDWGEWSNCSADCGGGERSRTYIITTPASGSGNSCTHASGDVETENCNTDACNVDCVGDWSEWSNCSVTCGGGVQTKTYKITLPAGGSGEACEIEDGNVLERTCNTDACPIDCEGYWEQEYGNCISSGVTENGTLCGQGVMTRKYHVVRQAENGGKSCTDENGNIIHHLYQMEQPCPALPACPVDCEGSWGTNYSQCACTDSSRPGVGTKYISYSVSQQKNESGKACEATDGQKSWADCNCPVDCVGSWNNPNCSHDAQGDKTFTYSISQPALFGGKACPHTNGATKVEFCNGDPERSQGVSNHDRNLGDMSRQTIRGPVGTTGALEVRASWKRRHPATWGGKDNGVNVYINDQHRIQWKRNETGTGGRKSANPAVAWLAVKAGDVIKTNENGDYTEDATIYWKFHPGRTDGNPGFIQGGGEK